MTVTDRTRNRILSSAGDVFIEQGLFQTSMDDVARKAGLTRRTLYRYFDSKEKLTYEVIIPLLEEWNSTQQEIYVKLRGNGLSRLKAFLYGQLEAMSRKIPVMRLMAEFDFYFQDKNVFLPDSDTETRFSRASAKSDTLILSLLKEGLSDGSIVFEETPEKIEATISSVLWSFGEKVALNMGKLDKEFGFDPVELIRTQIDLYIRALDPGSEER